MLKDERQFQKKLGIDHVAMKQEREALDKERTKLGRNNEEDRKIIGNKDILSYKKLQQKKEWHSVKESSQLDNSPA